VEARLHEALISKVIYDRITKRNPSAVIGLGVAKALHGNTTVNVMNSCTRITGRLTVRAAVNNLPVWTPLIDIYARRGVQIV